jgi:hypothetical protein
LTPPSSSHLEYSTSPPSPPSPLSLLRPLRLLHPLRLLRPLRLLGLLRGTAGPRTRPWRTRLPSWRCGEWCFLLYRLPADKPIPRCSSASSPTNSPCSCSEAVLSILPPPRLDGLPGLYWLAADRSGNCSTGGTRHGGVNFFRLGKVYPYCVQEYEEFAMCQLVPIPGDNSSGQAAECHRIQRFVALALRKFVCYPQVSLELHPISRRALHLLYDSTFGLCCVP